MVYGQIEQLYTVRTLEPTLTRIDDDVDVLVLVHPKALPPAALYAIDQFAMRGGHVLAFVDPNAQADQSGARSEQSRWRSSCADKSSHLEPLLAAWGVDFRVRPGGRRPRARPGRSDARGRAALQHIAILGLDGSSMAKDVVTAQLDSINMVTAGSLKPVAGSEAQVRAADPHAATRPDCCPRSASRMMTDPRVAARRLQAERRTRGRGARFGQRDTSAFPDGPPAGVAAAADALKASAKPLNVVVIADTDLLSDYMWVQQTQLLRPGRSRSRSPTTASSCWNALDNLARQQRSHQHSRPRRVLAALRPGRSAAAQCRRAVPRHGSSSCRKTAADRRHADQAADRASPDGGESLLS